MATSRRVPVPRGSASGSAARPVSHPGTGGATAPAFHSPFQPPHGWNDLLHDISASDPRAWHPITVAGEFFRVRVSLAAEIIRVNEAMTAKGGQRLAALHAFLSEVMHPEDFRRVLERMIDPDDAFGVEDFRSLFEQCVSLGTARPFALSPSSSASPPRTGAVSGRASFWAGWETRSAR